MKNSPRLLFFCRGASPTKDEATDMKRQTARGFDVHARNAHYAKLEGALEPADAIAGSAAPKLYQDAYPWADDFDPDAVHAIGEEWLDEDGVAWVRAVRGDGVAYNMLLSIAAPAAIGSGAPTHGVFAGVDHTARIKAGQGDTEATGSGTDGSMGDEASDIAGKGTERPGKPPVAKRKPSPAWKRNA